MPSSSATTTSRRVRCSPRCGLGIDVPRRVAIAGFNDLTGSDQMLPPLTTVRTPRVEIGTAAARMLLTLMKGESPPAPCVDLGYELVVRQST
jgi:LacI family gluconate utilization system Gnt-I transcriptional repressor